MGDLSSTIGTLLIYATIKYIYCSYDLLPEQSLYILLGKSNSTSRTFPLSRSNPTVKAAFTERYLLVGSQVTGCVNLLCIHLIMTCCLKFCSQQEHFNSFLSSALAYEQEADLQVTYPSLLSIAIHQPTYPCPEQQSMLPASPSIS